VSDAKRPGPALEPGVVEGDWEYQPVRLPPDVSRSSAMTELGLRSQFGGEYERYCNRTSRLIPGVY